MPIERETAKMQLQNPVARIAARASLVGAVLLSATLLVACGGDNEPSADPPFGGQPRQDGSGTGAGGETTQGPTISVSLSSPTVTAGTPATVTAEVTNASGAVVGQVVDFSTKNGLGQFSAPSALTNAKGQATVTLVPADSAAAGADTVVASVTVDGATATASTGFQLTA